MACVASRALPSCAARAGRFHGATLVQQGKIAPCDRMILACVGIGVAVRAQAPKPDISSVEAFRRTLLAAKSIVYTDPATGGASGIISRKCSIASAPPRRSKPNRS